MLEPIYNNPGYTEFVTWLDNKLINPTGGELALITSVRNTLIVDDVYFFLIEMYSDYRQTNYKGVLAISANLDALYIENNELKWANTVGIEVQDIFTMYPDGLRSFSDGAISLYDAALVGFDATLANNIAREFGSDRPYVMIYPGNIGAVEPESFGFINGESFKDQILGSYNIKIDRTPFATVTVRGAKDALTRFDIEIANGVFKTFTYKKFNEVLTVQDTASSRRDLKLLADTGIVFLDF